MHLSLSSKLHLLKGGFIIRKQHPGYSSMQSGPLLKDLISESIVKRINILNKHWKQMFKFPSLLYLKNDIGRSYPFRLYHQPRQEGTQL